MYNKQTAQPAAGTAVLAGTLNLIDHKLELTHVDHRNPGGEKSGHGKPPVDISAALKLFAKVVGALVVVAGAVVFGYQFWQHASTHEQTDDAYVTGHVNTVSSRVAGVVKSVLVDDNEYVKEGQPLALLDPADFQVAVNNAIASLNKAERGATAAGVSIDYSSTKASAMKNDAQGAIDASVSAIEKAKASLENAKSGVPMAESALKQREAELHFAHLNFNRMKSLREQGAISQQDLDKAIKECDVAEGAVRSAKEAVLQSEAQVHMAEQGVADAVAQLTRSQASLEQAKAQSVQAVVDKHQFDVSKAAIAEAQAKLDNAKLQLSYTRICAPVSGRIGKKTVEIGQHVQAGQPLLAVIPQKMWIVANFKETQLERMKPGQVVHIKIDALPSTTLNGKVESFSPGSGSQFALLPADNATGNFTKIVQRVPVKILLDERGLSRELISKIVPGMSAEVEVTTGG